MYWQQTYEYRAYLQIHDLTLHLDDGYASKALVIMIIASVLAFAMVMAAAMTVKRARVYGVIVAVMQPVGMYAAMQYVLRYAQIDFSGLLTETKSSVSMADAKEALYAMLADIFVEDIWPGYISVVAWGLVLLAVTVMTLVYVCMLRKETGKKLATAAMVILIVRQLLVSPIEQLGLLMGRGSSAAQGTWSVIYTALCLLPLVLICIQGVLNVRRNEPVQEQTDGVCEE